MSELEGLRERLRALEGRKNAFAVQLEETRAALAEVTSSAAVEEVERLLARSAALELLLAAAGREHAAVDALASEAQHAEWYDRTSGERYRRQVAEEVATLRARLEVIDGHLADPTWMKPVRDKSRLLGMDSLNMGVLRERDKAVLRREREQVQARLDELTGAAAA